MEGGTYGLQICGSEARGLACEDPDPVVGAPDREVPIRQHRERPDYYQSKECQGRRVDRTRESGNEDSLFALAVLVCPDLDASLLACTCEPSI